MNSDHYLSENFLLDSHGIALEPLRRWRIPWLSWWKEIQWLSNLTERVREVCIFPITSAPDLVLDSFSGTSGYQLFWPFNTTLHVYVQRVKPTWVSQVNTRKGKIPNTLSELFLSPLFSESICTIWTSSLSIHSLPTGILHHHTLWRVCGRASPGPQAVLAAIPCSFFFGFLSSNRPICWKQVRLMNNCFINN